VTGPLPQHRLIDRVTQLCAADERLDAALIYGSFAQGTADEFSDIEFWLFFATGPGEPREWIEQVAPLLHLVRNEFGAQVAFFPGLIRGEFHFATAGDIASVGSWPARGGARAVVDRRGELSAVLAALPAEPARDSAEEICGRWVNWLLLAHHVEQRGEHLRALDALAHAQRHLLWMARLAEDSTGHWLTPSRLAERELRTTFPGTHQDVRAAWRSGRALWTKLGTPPAALLAELDLTLAEPGTSAGSAGG
jgi:lincosamide nucleotidyltransferase